MILDMTVRITVIIGHDLVHSAIILVIFHDLSMSGSNHCSPYP